MLLEITEDMNNFAWKFRREKAAVKGLICWANKQVVEKVDGILLANISLLKMVTFTEIESYLNV